MIEAIRDLRTNPRPPGVRKLTGRPAWRIRVGDYRVIYEIDDDNSTVLVVSLGHRSDVYRAGR
jgi:mRNA interferase RelE/StbE